MRVSRGKLQEGPPSTEPPYLHWLPSLATLTNTKAGIQSRAFIFRNPLQKPQPQRLLGHGRTGGRAAGLTGWQDEHCDSGRPSVHFKTASLQGRQHKRALIHSWHCLNERKLQQRPVGRESKRHPLEPEVKKTGWGRSILFLSAMHTVPGIYPHILGNLVKIKKKERHRLSGSSALGKDCMWLERDRKILETLYSIWHPSSFGLLNLTLASTMSSNPK